MNIKSPSEHSKNGLTYDAEMQLMFTKKRDGKFKKTGEEEKGGDADRLGLSIFFDVTSGGMQTNEFISSLKIETATGNNKTMSNFGTLAVAKAKAAGKTPS